MPRLPAHDDDPEILRGTRDYRLVLAHLHGLLLPRLYLEVGVRHGESLRLARSRGIGIDPQPDIPAPPLPERLQVHALTSDAYFALASPPGLDQPVDLAFIDGMHLFEFALRDFIHIERHAAPWSLVAIDAVLPGHPAQATRERHTRAWMGDVWRIAGCLREYRPDLTLHLFDTWPGGMLVVTGLDPGNDVLARNYDALVAAALADTAGPPDALIARHGVPAADDAALDAVCAPLLAQLALRRTAGPPAREDAIDDDD